MSEKLWLLILAIVSLVYSAPATCLGGVCSDNQRESNVLMQRLNRKGGQIPLKVAKQARPVVKVEQNKQVFELYEVAVSLMNNSLPENQTRPVLIYVEDMLAELEQMIFPQLREAYEEDKAFLEEMLKPFHAAEANFETHWKEYEEAVHNETQASHVFKVCTDDDVNKCDAWTQCEKELLRRWKIYEESEQNYLSVTSVIEDKWCQSTSEDRSESEWKTIILSRFEYFILVGQERITKLEAHDEWKLTCDASERILDDAVTVCADRKRELEELSCRRHTLYHRAWRDLNATWEVARSHYTTALTSIKGKECYRAQTVKILQTVRCILKYLHTRCTGDCDAPLASNEISTVLDECSNFWKSDEAMKISALIFPPVPRKPTGPEAGHIPCSKEYCSAHYSDLDGPCYAAMPACYSCGGLADIPSSSPMPDDDLSDDELDEMAKANCPSR